MNNFKTHSKGYSLLEWVQKAEIRREIKLRFSNYLRTTCDANGHPIYKEKIKQMVMENKQSLEVDYKFLAKDRSSNIFSKKSVEKKNIKILYKKTIS